MRGGQTFFKSPKGGVGKKIHQLYNHIHIENEELCFNTNISSMFFLSYMCQQFEYIKLYIVLANMP